MTKQKKSSRVPRIFLVFSVVIFVLAAVAFLNREYIYYYSFLNFSRSDNILQKRETSSFTTKDGTVQFSYPNGWKMYDVASERGMFGAFSHAGDLTSSDGQINMDFSLHQFQQPISKSKDFPSCSGSRVICITKKINNTDFTKAVAWSGDYTTLSLTSYKNDKAFHIVGTVKKGKDSQKNLQLVEDIFDSLQYKD